MQTRLIRLRFRRRLRKGQRQVEDLGVQAEQQLDQHLLKRFGRLVPIRRFVLGWVGLLLLLIGALVVQNITLSAYYQTLQTVPGGLYNEGVRGRFTNANPMYATSDADATVSRLIFAGLLTYDRQGKLTGDLASDYSVDSHGTGYTVHLKPNLKWQDGRPLTSADVVFTYQLIQNPDAQSPLLGSWQGIEVSAPDARTVVFRLPGILASFPYNLTSGIVPKHLLAGVPAADLRSVDFNTVRPVGAGPFAWQGIQVKGGSDPKAAQQQIGLTPFAGYNGGRPKLQKFTVKVFASEKQLIQAFADNQLTAVEGLNDVPRELQNKSSVIRRSLPLRAATMVFFKTSSGILADQTVRHSLVQATDTGGIIKRLGYPSRAVREPFLAGQPGYDPAYAQPGFDLKAARSALDAAGWTTGSDGLRHKDGQPLSFTLTAANTPEYRMVAGQLQRQWYDAGAKLNVRFLEPADFQNSLTYHDYDALLNGISIGPDPDVFVYWDSSQADIRSANRLNLSEYKNAAADEALKAGRTRLDPAVRAVKYKPFLQAWQQDSPAVGLYQPRLLYLTNGRVSGLDDHALNTPIDRFSNVHHWQIREAKVTN
jgi:peptide/nickel transport system substrate-binding protein